MSDDGTSSERERRQISSRRSKRVVCTSCRQSKVRCIGSERDRCERCTRLELDCNRDPGFKRVSKNSKIANLEKQVQLLASVVNPGQPTSVLRIPPTPPIAPGQAQSAGGLLHDNFATSSPGAEANAWQRPQQSSQQPNHSFAADFPSILDPLISTTAVDLSDSGPVRPSTLMPRTIETLKLGPEQIDTLFQAFFENYHPFLPFLDPSRSPDTYYKSSPVLFWSLIGVASRRYRDDATLLAILSEWTMKLIWAEISKPPYKLSTVQAIIVLSIWPFPKSTTSNDITVTLSSIAVSAAMQIGLHRPLNSQDFLRSNANLNELDLSVLIKTWAVANIVSQSSGAVAGHLPNAPFDWIIDKACTVGNIYTLPDPLRFKLKIQRYCHQVTQAMCSISYDPINAQSPPPGEISTFMMSWQNDMAHFESDLDRLEQEHRPQFSVTDHLYLAAARVHLHSFYFLDTSTSDSREAGIVKAYNSAIDLISTFMSADRADAILLYLPFYHFRSLLTATCILLKVLRSSYVERLDNSDSGRKAFNEAILAISRSSVSNNDTAGKAVNMLSRVWHSSTSSKQCAPQLNVKSRFSASIMYDFVWTWRREFGGTSMMNNGLSSETTHESSMAQSPNLFQDSPMFNLDFLDDRGWASSFGEAPLFGG